MTRREPDPHDRIRAIITQALEGAGVDKTLDTVLERVVEQIEADPELRHEVLHSSLRSSLMSNFWLRPR